ncbi:LysR family transcriptional regulator [Steroidobacter sp. S1-65]|uniref:LysR family transcriptional regulator n=1 Tax=Steroidobacter gossypii TaxID=2805490 RepID=A0ABS1X0P6_9GAMM|nr:LysR family transcriptional regulator [Steroidobacter gossypii]MBM0106796.1 LysR family transcriptional regulator [Steroidobacter gossypii]
MAQFTLNELQCFDAVVQAGAFQAAATRLHRSHPAVFAAVAKLEQQLGVQLLDRSGYRVQPTEAGRSLHRRVQGLLQLAEDVGTHARQLAMGEETQLRVVLGDLCPRPALLGLLSTFFARFRQTRLHLHFEAVTGPWERLFDDEADLIVHRIDKSDERLEWIDLGKVTLIPVAAPGFLPFPVTATIAPAQMRDLTQCVIRDTTRRGPGESHYIVDGAHQCTVADHTMKKELIVQGMAWGHLPRFLIEDELRDGRLVSLAGRHYPGVVEDLVVARRADRPHGPIASRLWSYLQEQAPSVRSQLAPAPTRGRSEPRSRRRVKPRR